MRKGALTGDSLHVIQAVLIIKHPYKTHITSLLEHHDHVCSSHQHQQLSAHLLSSSLVPHTVPINLVATHNKTPTSHMLELLSRHRQLSSHLHSYHSHTVRTNLVETLVCLRCTSITSAIMADIASTPHTSAYAFVHGRGVSHFLSSTAALPQLNLSPVVCLLHKLASRPPRVRLARYPPEVKLKLSSYPPRLELSS